MIVDSSALIALLRREDDAPVFQRAVYDADRLAISSPTLLEASIVATPSARPDLDRLLSDNDVEVVAFTREHALLARDAYARFGKGSGSPAKLNFGDCISYALAKATGDPLLFKGDDFTHTDIESAL